MNRDGGLGDKLLLEYIILLKQDGTTEEVNKWPNEQEEKHKIAVIWILSRATHPLQLQDTIRQSDAHKFLMVAYDVQFTLICPTVQPVVQTIGEFTGKFTSFWIIKF